MNDFELTTEDHTRNALDAINKVRCMLWSNAKSKRAYEKMTLSSEYAVSELHSALGIDSDHDEQEQNDG